MFGLPASQTRWPLAMVSESCAAVMRFLKSEIPAVQFLAKTSSRIHECGMKSTSLERLVEVRELF